MVTFLLLNFADIKGPLKEELTGTATNLEIQQPIGTDFRKPKMISSWRLSLLLVLSLSTLHVLWCHPVLSYKHHQESGKANYFLILLSSCPPRLDGSEGLTFLRPVLEMTPKKRSFRNGVGAGVKKTSFRRAKR